MTDNVVLVPINELKSIVASAVADALKEHLSNSSLMLNKGQAAKHLGICRNTLARLARKPGFPQPIEGFYRIGDIEKWARLQS